MIFHSSVRFFRDQTFPKTGGSAKTRTSNNQETGNTGALSVDASPEMLIGTGVEVDSGVGDLIDGNVGVGVGVFVSVGCIVWVGATVIVGVSDCVDVDVTVGAAVIVGVPVTAGVAVWVAVLVGVGVSELAKAAGEICIPTSGMKTFCSSSSAGISATFTAKGPAVVWLPASSSAAIHTR